MQLWQRREYPRVESDLPVEFIFDDQQGSTRALNFSGGGLFINLSQPLSLNSEILLRFRPARHLPVMEARAVVRHQVAPQGVGVEFTEIAPEHHRMILRLVLKRGVGKQGSLEPRSVIQVEHDGGMLLGFSRLITSEGMFIETKKVPRKGADLLLRFRLQEDAPLIVAEADVVYTIEKVGMGVRFILLSEADQERLNAFVASSESCKV